MDRYFNNKKVELLAPAGTFDIFKEIITSGCDAVYFGGKNFNMRLHRKGYNLSDEELCEAVHIAHSLGKKVYITVNNLYGEQELDSLQEFLFLLNDKIRPDALIVQDMSVLSLVKEYAMDLSLHSSVMMNTHNLETIHALSKMGVTRVVLSREAPLSYSRYLAAKTNMELEYFIHGDMCTVHGGQCLYSGILFQQSSNRGRCLKPCRWGYEIIQNGKKYLTQFPLAAKDLCLYEHIPELIDGGITSFKIEGRMRDAQYLKKILCTYSDTIDRYLEDPLSYDRKKESLELYESRKRDTSTAYAFGNPGLSNINTRYEGTGALYSSGKMFSTATEERSATADRIHEIKKELKSHKIGNQESPKLHVKLNNWQQAKICLDLGVDSIYLSGDVFLPDLPFSKKKMEELIAEKGKTSIYLGMPHMMFDIQFEQYQHFLSKDIGLDGLIASNLGGIHAFRKYNLIGDYPLNILNSKAANMLMESGLKRFTITPEASLNETISLLEQTKTSAELIIHGSPTVMYLEHDLYANVNSDQEGVLYLVDGEGFQHPVYKDQYGRNHMYLYKDLCYLPILKELYETGLTHFRIEAQHLPANDLARIIKTYQRAFNDLDCCQSLYEELRVEQQDFTLGSFAIKGGVSN